MFNNHNLPKSLVNEAANVLGETNADFDLPQQLVEALADAVADYRMCSTFEDRRAIIEWHAEQAIDSEDLDAKDLNNFARAVEYAAMNEGVGRVLGSVAGAASKIGKKIQDVVSKAVPGGKYRTPNPSQEAVNRLMRQRNNQATTTPQPENSSSPPEKSKPESDLDLDHRFRSGEALVPKDTRWDSNQPPQPISSKNVTGPDMKAIMGRKNLYGGTNFYHGGLVRPGSMSRKNYYEPRYYIEPQSSKKESVDYSQLLDVLASLNEDEFNAYLDLLSESEIAALEQIINENTK